MSTSLDILAAHSISHSRDVAHTAPEPDVIALDSIDFVKEQICQVNQRVDEVQREYVKSQEELGESSKGGSAGYKYPISQSRNARRSPFASDTSILVGAPPLPILFVTNQAIANDDT
ncbi:hypothetical protein B296_00001080 [Ensete ventricosum]|uniref:Uncharacterized protein n=1 Tax=Ensete ventricosum TaxID=4639 RepID=A0A427AVI8_ENSVE|nr:hypothetical protein B296_00001080 [Ensete ventricosum]